MAWHIIIWHAIIYSEMFLHCLAKINLAKQQISQAPLTYVKWISAFSISKQTYVCLCLSKLHLLQVSIFCLLLITLATNICCWFSICCCCRAAISWSSERVSSTRGFPTCRPKNVTSIHGMFWHWNFPQQRRLMPHSKLSED